jgi:hypothetical protein
MTDMNPLYTTLGKVLLKLESRARYGHFKKLTLVWEEKEWKELTNAYDANGIIVYSEDAPPFFHLFQDMLDGLRVGKEGGRFERVIEIKQDWVGDKWYQGKMARCISTAGALHIAFGGKAFVGERLVWYEERIVGSFGGIKEGIYTF